MTNASAIVALVVCLISFMTSFFLAVIGGIVFGNVARSQIRTRGERGTGMIVAALRLGYLNVLFWIVFWLVYFGIIALLIGVGMGAEGRHREPRFFGPTTAARPPRRTAARQPKQTWDCPVFCHRG